MTPEQKLKLVNTLGKTLALASLRGHWRIEDLDHRSQNTRAMQSDIDRAARLGLGTPIQYTNIAREWMDSNPKEWDEALTQSLDAENLEHLPGHQEIMAAAGLSVAPW